MASSSNPSWYSIQAQAGVRRAKINIHEQIGEGWFGEGVSAKAFVADMDKLDVDAIDLHINSPGGNVFDGMTIYNALKAHKAQVHVTVDGLAASIASVIAMAGDRVVMPESAMMMIHDPTGFVIGNASTMRKTARALDKVKSSIVSTYMTRSKDDEQSITQMMSDETWLTAEEAVDIGFADEIIQGVKAQNCAFDMLNQFKKVPAQFLNAAAKPEPKQAEEEKPMPITIDQLRQEHQEIVNALLDEGKTLGRQDGAKAERQRIQAVRAQLLPGHEQLIDDLANDGVTTGEQAAVRILQAEKQLRAQAKQAIATDAAAVPQVPQAVAPEAQSPEDLTTEAGMKAKWDKDAALREEFANDFAAYQAYQQALNRGSIRILKK